MKIVEPWKIFYGVVNLKDLVDVNELKDEIFNLSCLTNQEDEAQSFITEDFIPSIIALRDQHIIPAATKFMLEHYDFDGDFDRVDTNAKWIPPGEALYPHYHAGSIVSTIFYPEDSESGLNVFDPRSNACRGYPQQVRDRHFAMHKFSPRAGDLIILPSYLQHSVSYVKEDVRLSLVNEFYIKNLY